MRTVAKITLPMGAACLLLAAVPAQAETKILFNYFVPPKHPLKVGIMDNWSKRVAEGSNGRIEVSYPAKTLAPAPRQWKMITSGIADATVMYNNFERKRLSLDQVGTLPFSITDASSTATALWRTHKKYFEAKNQYKGVKFLGYIMHGGGELFSLKDPILSVADMKKMKLRSPPGDVAKAVGKTGAAVVPTPGVKAFDVVSKGIVDGMVFPIGDVWKLKMMPLRQAPHQGARQGLRRGFLALHEPEGVEQALEGRQGGCRGRVRREDIDGFQQLGQHRYPGRGDLPEERHRHS